MPNKELWQTKGAYWPISQVDNHMAELAAINKAARSVPINVSVEIATDSMASILSIKRALATPPGSPLLRTAGRPYLHAITRTIRAKKARGSKVTLTHVRSHTGLRDKRSIGNAEADRLAKWMAQATRKGQCPTQTAHDGMTLHTTSDLDMADNDLPYCLATTSWTAPPQGSDPTETKAIIRGDLRKAMKTSLQKTTRAEWASRPSRGKLFRTHQTSVLRAIAQTWKENPTSNSTACALRCLTQAPRSEAEESGWAVSPCDRCGTGHPNTVMGDLQCPANTALWNALDLDIEGNAIFSHPPEEPWPEWSSDNPMAISTRATGKAIIGHLKKLGVTDIDDYMEGYPLALQTILTIIKEGSSAPQRGDPADYEEITKEAISHAQSIGECARDNIIDASRYHRYWRCEQMRNLGRHFFRTYSDLHSTPLTSPGLWDCRWRTEDPRATKLGACLATPEEFMRNSFTWANLVPLHQQTSAINQAVLAMGSSTSHARVLIMVYDSQDLNTTLTNAVMSNNTDPARRRIRSHKIVSIPPEAVALTSNTTRLKEMDAGVGNTDALALVVIETMKAPQPDPCELATAIERLTGTTYHPIPWTQWPMPTDIGPYPEHPGPRHHPLLRPLQHWYRNDMPPVQAPKDKPPPPTETSNYHRLLGALGLLPLAPFTRIAEEKHPDGRTTPHRKRLERMNRRIRQTTLEAYRRAESWRKWKRRV